MGPRRRRRAHSPRRAVPAMLAWLVAAASRGGEAYTPPSPTASHTVTASVSVSPSWGTSYSATRSPTGTRTHTPSPTVSAAFGSPIEADVLYNLTVGNADVFLTTDCTAFGRYVVTITLDCLGVNTTDFGGAVTLTAANGGPPPCTGCSMGFAYQTRVDCYSVFSTGVRTVEWVTRPGSAPGAVDAGGLWYLRLHRDAAARAPYQPTLQLVHTIMSTLAPTPTTSRTPAATASALPLAPMGYITLGGFDSPGANASARYWVWHPNETATAAVPGGNVSSYGVYRFTLHVFGGAAVLSVGHAPPPWAGALPSALPGGTSVGREAVAAVVDVTTNERNINATFIVSVQCTVGNPIYSVVVAKVADSDGIVVDVVPPVVTDLAPIIAGVVLVFVAVVASATAVVVCSSRRARRKLAASQTHLRLESALALEAAAEEAAHDDGHPEDIEIGHGIVRHRPKAAVLAEADAPLPPSERKDAPRARPLVHIALIHHARTIGAGRGASTNAATGLADTPSTGALLPPAQPDSPPLLRPLAASSRRILAYTPAMAAQPVVVRPPPSAVADTEDEPDTDKGGGGTTLGGGHSSVSAVRAISAAGSGSDSPRGSPPQQVHPRPSPTAADAKAHAKRHAAYEAELAADLAAVTAEAGGTAPDAGGGSPLPPSDAPPPPPAHHGRAVAAVRVHVVHPPAAHLQALPAEREPAHSLPPPPPAPFGSSGGGSPVPDDMVEDLTGAPPTLHASRSTSPPPAAGRVPAHGRAAGLVHLAPLRGHRASNGSAQRAGPATGAAAVRGADRSTPTSPGSKGGGSTGGGSGGGGGGGRVVRVVHQRGGRRGSNTVSGTPSPTGSRGSHGSGGHMLLPGAAPGDSGW